MMALQNIKKEAQTIVEQLADRQIAGMLDRKLGFTEWMEQDGNPVMYGSFRMENEVDLYESIRKYVYVNFYKVWDRELGEYVADSEPYQRGYKTVQKFGKEERALISEINEMTRKGWMERYREQFIIANMAKLNRALAKHLTDEMTAKDIKVRVGGDGAEVTAIVDDMMFKTFGTLCGGWVQCLHYRYRSSLK